MTTATRFRTLAEVRAANAAIGHHFFDRDTMRFFNSRIVGDLIGGRYFITSERFDENTPRRYTVRAVENAKPPFSADGAIETVGEFQQYATIREARHAIRALLP